MDKFNMAGRPISVTLVGHGEPGAIQLGDVLLDASTKQDFVNGVKGKINMLTLFGCCVASGVGSDFVQWLANDLKISVMAYPAEIGVAKNDPDVMDGFYVEGGLDTKITFVPIPESSSVFGLLVFIGAVSTLKRKQKHKSTEKETTKVD